MRFCPGDHARTSKKVADHMKANDSNGFTLIELMIYMALFGVIMGAVYTSYKGQLDSYVLQRDVAEMQQNIRTALYLMDREIKMAGLNPTAAAGIGITAAESNRLVFSMDFEGGACDGLDNDNDGIVDEGCNGADDNGNGLIDEADEAEWFDGAANLADEQVTYVLSNDADGNGRNDGLATENNDAGTCDLLRNGQIIARNIDALNFVYLDENGAPLATPVPAANLGDIRSVQIAVIGRSGQRTGLRNFLNTENYLNQQGGLVLPPQNDTFRRIALNAEVRCRNLGL
jgi:type IV pilus assembly protein PilW